MFSDECILDCLLGTADDARIAELQQAVCHDNELHARCLFGAFATETWDSKVFDEVNRTEVVSSDEDLASATSTATSPADEDWLRRELEECISDLKLQSAGQMEFKCAAIFDTMMNRLTSAGKLRNDADDWARVCSQIAAHQAELAGQAARPVGTDDTVNMYADADTELTFGAYTSMPEKVCRRYAGWQRLKEIDELAANIYLLHTFGGRTTAEIAQAHGTREEVIALNLEAAIVEIAIN